MEASAHQSGDWTGNEWHEAATAAGFLNQDEDNLESVNAVLASSTKQRIELLNAIAKAIIIITSSPKVPLSAPINFLVLGTFVVQDAVVLLSCMTRLF